MTIDQHYHAGSAHALAALLLTESLIRELMARRTLTAARVRKILGVAIDVSGALAADRDPGIRLPAETMRMLQEIGASLGVGLPVYKPELDLS